MNKKKFRKKVKSQNLVKVKSQKVMHKLKLEKYRTDILDQFKDKIHQELIQE